MKASRKLPLALAAVLSLLLLSAPATAHTSLDFACDNPSPDTAGDPADTSCSVHLHYPDKTDWLRIDLPAGAVLNEDETPSNSGEGADDPDDGDKVGESVVATNFSSDFNCRTSDDLQDGGTYDVTWEDNWTSYTPPSGWIKVAQYNTTVLFVDIPTHVIKETATDVYATVTDLPTSLTCDGTPTNMTINTYSHVDNTDTNEWVGKNPTSTGNHTVTVTATTTANDVYTDSDTITIN